MSLKWQDWMYRLQHLISPSSKNWFKLEHHHYTASTVSHLKQQHRFFFFIFLRGYLYCWIFHRALNSNCNLIQNSKKMTEIINGPPPLPTLSYVMTFRHRAGKCPYKPSFMPRINCMRTRKGHRLRRSLELAHKPTPPGILVPMEPSTAGSVIEYGLLVSKYISDLRRDKLKKTVFLQSQLKWLFWWVG